MNWVKIIDSDILPANDFIRSINVAGKKLCIIKSGENFYATQPYCPHAGAALAFGWCKNDRLICPYHRYEYDLKTGRGAAGQGDYIDMYPVEVRADGVYVGIKESLLKKFFGL